MSDAEAVGTARGYDRLARFYRWLEYLLFRNNLQCAREALLTGLADVSRVLVLGDGDGRLLESLCRINSQCQITSVEQSSQMLALQRQRVAAANAIARVKFVQADGRDVSKFTGTYDALITAFFLDCFDEEELREHLPKWLEQAPGGLFYCVEFAEPAHGWRRLRANTYLSLMHWFFRWQTGLKATQLADFDALLSQHVSLLKSRNRSHGLIQSSLYRVT